jgi:hypothetical protein
MLSDRGAFCTRCGAPVAASAKRCAQCGAPRLRSGAPRILRRILLPFFIGSALAVVVFSIWFARRTSGRHGGLLDTNIASALPAEQLHISAGDATVGDMFFLPKADRNFVGIWGGYARLKSQPEGEVITSSRLPMTYYFGQQGDKVYLRTAIYGNASWPVVRARVTALTPERVQFQVDSACADCSTPIRQVEVTTLTLQPDRSMKVVVRGYAYRNGDGHGLVVYEGVLHRLNTEQADAISRQVKQNHVRLGAIKTARPVR